MSSSQRVFFDWKQAVLPQVAQRLLAPITAERPVDLSSLTVVFPTRRAGRRLLELLLDVTDGQLIPPRILTVGSLPEQLYVNRRPFATSYTQRLAWVRALQSLPEAVLRRIVHRPPHAEDHDAWMRVAELLASVHTELLGEQLQFADVAERGRELPGFDEVDRWQALADVQAAYLRELDAVGLWDQQTARLVAIQQHECRASGSLVIVGAVDLTRTQRAMLAQVADQVTYFIPAPEALADAFDEFGCVRPAVWLNMELPLRDDLLEIVDTPQGQVDAALRTLAGWGSTQRTDELTIGLPDQSLIRLMERGLRDMGMAAQRPIGPAFASTEPAQLVQTLIDCLTTNSTSSFAALIRQPAVSIWLSEQQRLGADWLIHWDRYFCESLPVSISDLPQASRSDDDVVVGRLNAAVESLLRPFRRRRRPLHDWAPALRDFLIALFGQRTINPDQGSERLLLEACELMLSQLETAREAPAEWAPAVAAVEALHWTLAELETTTLSPLAEEDGILLSGWLDLPLDDAPAMVVLSLNEGVVPSSVNHDLFLPNRLRQHLGMEDNDRRYARDAYALASLLHSRSRMKIVTARRNAEGDPLLPSRLLFAAPSDQIAGRVLRFLGEHGHDRIRFSDPPRPEPANGGFPIPEPRPRQRPLKSLRVTEFRDYLASPYRYYLRHVLRLEEVSDATAELDPAGFGTLLHEVLKRFGEGADRDSNSEAVIKRRLHGLLREVGVETYGDSPGAAVRIQLQQMQLRLSAFATWQAEWRRQGWQIHTVEAQSRPAPLLLDDGRQVLVTGRIDRIDFHPDSQRWALLDYKTSNRPTAPNGVHRRRDEWIDLQLPLYRHLARQHGVGEEMQLGYIQLPSESSQVGAVFAEWSAAELEEADDVARRVATAILNEEFWVDAAPDGYMLSEFNDICQTRVFGQELCR